MDFLRSFLRRHFLGKPKVALRNVSCFLQPIQTSLREYATGRDVSNSGYPWYRHVWEIRASQNLAELGENSQQQRKRALQKHRLARTWTQNTITKGSYRFLDPKFKTFCTLFSKKIISFSRLKVIKFICACKWSKETLKASLMMHCKHTGKIE